MTVIRGLQAAGCQACLSAIALSIVLAFAHAAAAQEILETRLTREDWGIDDVSEVRYGQFSLLFEASGTRLIPYQIGFGVEGAAGSVPGGTAGRTPDHDGDAFVLSEFASGNQNTLGGYFSAFSLPPASGVAGLSAAPDGSRALEVECDVRPDTFCGAWVHLFDTLAPPPERVFFDASPFQTLTFEIWTESPGDRISFKIADAEWEEREDAPPIGDLDDFVLAENPGPGWQQVTIPLERVSFRVDTRLLASLVFEVVSAGRTRFWIRNAAFLRDEESHPIFTSEPIADSEPVRDRYRRAVWAWFTEDWLDDPAMRDSAIAFLAERGVDTVFLQIPDSHTPGLDPGQRVLDTERLEPLVAMLSGAGMRTYALDGAPQFAMPEFHDGVLKTIDSVAEYNSRVDPASRFYGVRYDIEPHLLPGFHGHRRETILTSYLTLVDRMSEVAHRGGLKVGLDIPFWLDAPDERTFRTVDLDWKGTLAPVSRHLIDMVDDVTIMAYRTMAYGADGTIRHSIEEVRYAAEQGRDVFVALETGPLPDEMLIEFYGSPETGLGNASDADTVVALVPGGDSVSALLKPAGTPVALFLANFPETDPDSVVWWTVAGQTHVPAAKLTFDRSDATHLDRVVADTAFELMEFSSFAGFAIHHVESWKDLLARD